MAARDPRARTARAVLLTSVVLMGFGSCGLSKGLGAMGEPPVLPAVSTPDEAPEQSEAAEIAGRALAEALFSAPFARPLAVANVVVSAMLIVGAVLLFRRKTGAPWWIRQAVVANVLWTAAETTSFCFQLVRSRTELAAVLDQAAEAAQAAEDVSISGSVYVWVYVLIFLGFGLLRILVYAIVAVRSNRPDFHQFLATKPENRAP